MLHYQRLPVVRGRWLVVVEVPVRVAIRSQKVSAICCRQKSQWQLAWLVALEPSPWVPALTFNSRDGGGSVLGCVKLAMGQTGLWQWTSASLELALECWKV